MNAINNPPLVAIRCVTYNHEPYIRDTLNGFVMQKTNFPFIAIVHDDASTDGTADVIREYAAKYPDIIKPVYETENQYSKCDGGLFRMMNKFCLDSNAKYTAVCEGDDYWTDPHKLQKQVDFLEAHPNYSMVFASVKLQYGNDAAEQTIGFEERTYSPLEIYSGWAPTLTIVFRTIVFESDCMKALSQIEKPVFGDMTMEMACTTVGKIYGMSDIVGIYRKLPTGASQNLAKYPYSHLKNRMAISKYLGKDFVEVDKCRFRWKLLPSIKKIFVDFPEHFKFVCRMFWFAPGTCIKECLREIRYKIFHK